MENKVFNADENSAEQNESNNKLFRRNFMQEETLADENSAQHLPKISFNQMPLLGLTKEDDPKSEAEKLDVTGVEKINLQELSNLPLPPTDWIVDGLLTPGFWLLGSRPKIGKSRMALGLGFSIAAGETFLEKFKVRQGKVIFMALEDSLQRIKERSARITDADPRYDNEIIRKNFTFHLKFPALDAGGMERLEHEIANTPGVRAVILDTLPRLFGRTKDAYQQRYDCIAKMQQIAIKYGVAIIGIMHTGKQAKDNTLDGIIGSTGNTAAVDGGFVIGKKHDQFTFSMTGRDILTGEFLISFDEKSFQWKFEADIEDEDEISDSKSKIIEVLKKEGKPMRPKEIASELKEKDASLRVTLARMYKNGEIFKTDRGNYVTSEIYAKIKAGTG